MKNRAKRSRQAYTLPSPRIKFIGVFDTVKAVDDKRLYEIGQTDNTEHVRHALAMLENRKLFKLERYNIASDPRLKRTVSGWSLSVASPMDPQRGLQVWTRLRIQPRRRPEYPRSGRIHDAAWQGTEQNTIQEWRGG
jgi:uncharacterized protein (DUF2235 family)